MLPPAGPIGARPPRAVEAVTPTSTVRDPRREIFDRLTQIALGKTFQAEVLSRLNDGTYLIKIDNAALRAALPGNLQAGATLSLRFVATQPRPTFLITQAQDADTTSLSSAAKLIDTILHASQRSSMTDAVAGKAAIFPDMAGDALKIASALKHTLTLSGVFYESHLSQWAEGSRPLAELQLEPQARLNQDYPQFAAPLLQQGKSLSTQLVDIVSAWEGAMPSGAQAGSANAAASTAATLSNEIMQLVNLQLQALEQHKIIWHGEAWPGQPLEWEVSEDQKQGQPDAEAAPSWTSTVRFSLPTLGAVAATICLTGNRVHMQLQAASEQTACLLRARGAELASSLDAAGSPLDALMVKQDEQAA